MNLVEIIIFNYHDLNHNDMIYWEYRVATKCTIGFYTQIWWNWIVFYGFIFWTILYKTCQYVLSGRVLYYLILKSQRGQRPSEIAFELLYSQDISYDFNFFLNILTHKLLSLLSHFFNKTIWLVSWKIHENTELNFFIFDENMWWALTS